MKRTFLALLVVLSVRAHAQCPSVTWGPPQTLPSTTSVHDLVTLDFNSDGKLDLVGEMLPGGGAFVEDLYSWVGHGDGTFDAPVSLDEHQVRDVALADLNNDGRQDVVMATYRGVISARLNTGSGFGPAITTTTSAYQGDRIAVGKFDNDAYPDVVVGSYYSNIFVIYHGVGNGTFTEIRRDAAQTPLPLMTGDFDGDGRTDVAYGVREQRIVYVAFRNADGTFTTVALPASDFPADIAAGDFNEDGKQDVVAVNWEEFVARPQRSVMVYLAGPSRTFTRSIMTASIVNSTSSYGSVKVADLNGDQHLDIVTVALNGSLSLTFLGKGNGTFSSATHLITPDPYDISLGDVDGDTRPDMIVGGWNGVSTLKNTCATHVHLYTVSPVITSGQAAPLRALVSAISSSTPQPRGTVTFREGSTSLGTVDVDPFGIAQLEATGLTLGTHTIRAEFSGNTELAPATSLNITQQVISGSSSIRIDLPPGAGSSYGTPYPIGVTVTSYNGFETDGWVTISWDGVEALQAWSGTAMSLSLAPGPHVLTAHFYGDAIQPPSDSVPVNIVTAKATTALNYTGTLTVRQGTAHAIAVQVTGPQGTTPTGTVELRRGATVLASGAVVNGVANLSATLERGSHDLVAVYSGNGNFNASSTNLTLTVVQNATVAIEARGLPNAISIRAVYPANATNITLYRRLGGTNNVLLPLNGWTPAVQYDTTAVRGVLYDYRLEATVNGVVQASSLDSAILFTDEGLASAQTVIHHTHFDELRLAVNALRANAGLAPFDYDNLFFGAIVRAVHLSALRNALTEARQALGMVPATYTDPATAGTIVKAVQLQELRELAR